MNEDYHDILDVHQDDLTRADMVAQFGLPTNRIDILTGVSGLVFKEAWSNRVEELVERVRVPVLGLKDLLANQLASNREEGSR